MKRKKTMYNFSIYCNLFTKVKDVQEKVMALGYKLCAVTIPEVDERFHRFGCVGKNKTPLKDHTILRKVEGVDLVLWRKTCEDVADKRPQEKTIPVSA